METLISNERFVARLMVIVMHNDPPGYTMTTMVQSSSTRTLAYSDLKFKATGPEKKIPDCTPTWRLFHLYDWCP